MSKPPHPSPVRGALLFGAFSLLCGVLLFCNVAQALSIALRPISERAVLLANNRIAGFWWGLCSQIMERIGRVRVITTGDVVPDQENAAVVANHQGMTDIPVLFPFALRRRSLGSIKWIVKDAIKWVPGVGWGMKLMGCVFVKRRWTDDADSIEAAFRRLRRLDAPVWLVAFPEGTRLAPDKLEASRRWATERGVDPPEHVLIPRTKGFVATLRGLQGHLASVLDLTIAYPGAAPGFLDLITGRVTEVHLHVSRTRIDELPPDDEGRAHWLKARFAAKDSLLAAFRRDGRFPGKPHDEPVPPLSAVLR